MHYGDGTVNILEHKDYVTIFNPDRHDRTKYMDDISRNLSECSADLIGISAGFDNHRQDWGGVLATEDYTEIGSLVRSAAIRNKGGCFGILEGGYNHKVLGVNVLALIRGLQG